MGNSTTPMEIEDMFKQALSFILIMIYSGFALSEIRIIDSSSIKNGLKTFVTTVCIDGYKFVVTNGTEQFFILKDEKVVPAQCSMK